MTWRTHVAVGANAIWLSAFALPDKSILILLPAAMIASLLADLDASAAKIHFVGGGALGIFHGSGKHGIFLHHRGIMHSLFATLILFILLLYFFHDSVPLLPYVAALAFFSHPLIDGFNGGVGYLYPFVRKQYAFLPSKIRPRVGGTFDNLLMFAAILGIFLFFLIFQKQFLPS